MRTLALLWRFTRVNLLNQLAFPSSFILAVTGKMIHMSIVILFFHVLYGFTASIAGWNERDILIVIASYLTVESLAIITYHRNLFYYFPKLLSKGEFDLMLVRPLPTLTFTAFRVIDLMDMTSFLLVIGLWWYALAHTTIVFTIGHILLFLFLLACALVSLFAIEVLLVSTAFWTLQALGLGRLTESVMRLGRYPTDLFRGGWQILVTYVLPIAVIATLPAKALRGTLHPASATIAFGITCILFAFALSFWRFALRHYSSASA